VTADENGSSVYYRLLVFSEFAFCCSLPPPGGIERPSIVARLREFALRLLSVATPIASYAPSSGFDRYATARIIANSR
jgi:hypothetical protein